MQACPNFVFVIWLLSIRDLSTRLLIILCGCGGMIGCIILTANSSFLILDLAFEDLEICKKLKSYILFSARINMSSLWFVYDNSVKNTLY